VYINRIEAEAWKAMPDNRSAQAKKVLEVYKDHLHLFEAGDMLPGGVKSIAAYGHTPGHTAFQKDKILVIGDLMHGAALQLKYPNYNASFDMDKEAAQEARTRLIKLARENGLTMYGMHLPSPGFVK
jgi:glyoxylase-like metal-dependent hydrolase (beta-lactamase superfamily II)